MGVLEMKSFLLGLLAFALGLFSVGAQAAVPVAITTAITDAGVDAAAVATAVIVVLFGIFAIKLMRKGM